MIRSLVVQILFFSFVSLSVFARGDVLLDFKVSSFKKVSQPNNALWNQWLKSYVKSNGSVNYKKGSRKIAGVKKYLEYLLQINPNTIKSKSSRLAYHINLYNALIVYGVLSYYPIRSVRKIKNDRFFKLKFFYKNKKISINQLEKKIILPKFREPLVHFALNCASYSCPPLRNKAYTGKGIKKQLVRQTKAYLKNREFVRLDPKSKTLHIIELFQWYKNDLGNPRKFYQKYAGSKVNISSFDVKFIKYNWNLNGI